MLAIFRGMIPMAIPKFTNPYPAGNEILNEIPLLESPTIPSTDGIGKQHSIEP